MESAQRTRATVRGPATHFVRLMRAAWLEYERDGARYFAVAMVYYALVSLIPLLLLLLAALGLLLRFSSYAAAAEQQMLGRIAASFGTQVMETIEGLLNTVQQGSIIATLISLAGLLFTASVLFRQLRMGFRAIWKYEPLLVGGTVRDVVRATVLEYVIAFVMVAGGGGMLLATLVLIAASQWLNARLLDSLPLLNYTHWLAALAGSLIVAAITFGLLFKFLPPVPIRWREVWLAAVLCAVAWVVASEFLTLYSLFFEDSLSAYGAIGGLLAIMLWMNIVSQVLFFGAEMCKVVAMQGGGLARS